MKVQFIRIWLTIFLFTSSFTSFSAEFYWVGGNGSWTDASHWAATSGGNGGIGIPSVTDNVTIDNNSFSSSGQSISVSGSASCNNLIWTSSLYQNELKGKSSTSIEITGSYINTSSSFIDSYEGQLLFTGSGNNTLSLSKSTNANIVFNGSGSWNLNSNISTTQSITLTSGTLSTNDKVISASSFIGSGTIKRALYLGKSVVTVNKWLFAITTNLSFDASNAKIIVTGNWDTDLQRGNLTYNILTNQDKRAFAIDSILITPYTCDTLGKAKGKITVYVSFTAPTNNPFNFKLYEDGVLKQTSNLKNAPYTFDYLALDPSYGHTYTVDVTKGSTISGTTTYTTWPTPMSVTISVDKHVTCAGFGTSFDAELRANPSGGVGPYTYKWLITPQQTTQVATGLTNGTWGCDVTDKNSCVYSGTINYYPGGIGYTGPNYFVFTNDPPTNTASCGSQNNGTISIKMTGGLGPRLFKLVNATDNRPYQSDSNFTGLHTGLTYQVWAKDSVGCEKQASDVTIGSIPEPTVNVGVDTTICEDLNMSLASTKVTNFSTLKWVTSGTGTFTNDAIANPTYLVSAADKTAGSVTLTLTVTGNAGCNVISDSRVITISKLPTAAAGADVPVCLSNIEYKLSNAAATNYSTITWLSSGDGSFDNAAIVQPKYTFGTNDINNKTVELKISVKGTSGCATRIVADSMKYLMSDTAFSAAGTNLNICKTATYTASSADAHGYSSLLWTTSGSGIFSQATDLKPTYTPSAADKTAGTVTLTLTAKGISPCPDYGSSVTLTLDNPPTVSAGNDSTVCFNGPFTLNQPTKTFSTVAWTTSGDGSFNNATTINPIYTPGANDNTNGTVKLIVTATGLSGCSTTIIKDSMNLNMIDSALASAGTDHDLCKGSKLSISDATAANYSSLQWTSSGDGTFSAPTALITDYTPGANDLTKNAITLTLTSKGNNPCPDVPSSITLNLFNPPTITAGNDSTVCFNGPFTLNQPTNTFSTVSWSTSGDGSFNNATTINPIYTPGANDNTNGTVKLIVTATGLDGCISKIIKDSMNLNMIDSALASAGTDHDLCKGSKLSISDATAANYSSLQWTSSGDGTFSAPTALISDYTPGANDLTKNAITLTLTSKGISPCPDVPSSITLNLFNQPTVEVGNDTTLCAKNPYTIATSSATFYSSLTWTAPGGDGNFDNTATLHPTYSPGATDKTSGKVKLRLEVTGKDACSSMKKADSLILTMNDQATVSAGANMNVCKGNAVTITDAIATNYALLTWTSPTGGSFDDANSMLPIYTPSAADLANGSVILTLTASGLPSCSDPQSDKKITFFDKVVANSGGDTIICYNETFTFIKDAASNYSSLLWTTSGDGTLSSTNTLHPIYTPGTQDLSDGFVLLTLQADGFADCLPTSSSMTLNIDKGPQIYAGDPIEICYNVSATISTSTATDYAALLWTTSGDGTFDDATKLHPKYTPGAADLAAHTATLTLKATGKSACKSATSTVVISILNELTENITSPTSKVSCYGKCDAETHVIVGGGNAPYTYTWNDPSVTGKDTLLCKGTFTCTVMDSKGCMVNKSITITEPLKITTSFVKTDNKCYGDALGNSTVTPANGFVPYSYVWSTGSTTNVASNLTSGYKVVTVTDNNGCSVIDSVEITDPPQLTSTFNLNLPSCPGDADGSITAIPSGGTLTSPDYSYKWSNGSTNKTISNLSTANFTITITDDNNCTFDSTFNFPDPAPLAVTFDITNVKCYGDSTGKIVANVTGGTEPYVTAQWTDLANTNGFELSNLPESNYQFYVEDSKGCSYFSASQFVTQPPKFSVGVGKPTSFLVQNTTKIAVCFKGKHDMVQDIGFNLIAPNGTVLELKQSPSITGAPNPPCNYGRNFDVCFTTEAPSTLDMCVPTPWPASWTDNNRIGWPSNPAISGDYKPSNPWNVIYGQDPSNGGWALEIMDCFPNKVGEEKDSSVWQNASLSFTDLNTATGLEETILFQQTGINLDIKNPITGCESTKIKIPLKLSTSCYGVCDAEGVMYPVGGIAPYTYTWNDPTIPSMDTLMMCAGSYKVTATDANGCTSVGGVNIIQPAKISANLDSVNNQCYGLAIGKAWATIDSGGVAPFDYLWSTNAITSKIENLTAGKYFLTITDDNNCHQVDSIVVLDSIKVLTDITIDSTKCHLSSDGAILLTPKGGKTPYTYLWQDATTNSSLSNIPSGTYTVTVKDKDLCRLDTSATVYSPLPIQFTGVTISSPTCISKSDASIIISLSGGTLPYSYKWANNPKTWTADSTRDKLESISAGKYDLRITDKYGCIKDTSFTITDPLAMDPTIIATDSVKCNGDATAQATVSVVNGTAPYVYTWSNGIVNDKITNLSAGKYKVTITDNFGCTVLDSAVISEPNILALTPSIIDSVTCFNTNTANIKVSTIGGTKSYTFAWSNGATDSVNSGVGKGTYTVTVTDKYGCEANTSVTATEPTQFVITKLVSSPSQCNSPTGKAYVEVQGATKPYTYAWSNAGNGDTIKNVLKGDYSITVTDKNGCTVDSSVTVKDTTTLKVTSATIQKSISCIGRKDGSGYISISGGDSPYSIVWSDASATTNDTITKLAVGTYYVTVTDINTCTKTDSITIDQSEVLAASIDSTKDISCHLTSDGLLRVKATGGAATGGYSYIWSNAITSALNDNLTVGKYTVTVSDTSNCQVIVKDSLKQVLLTASFKSTKDILCDSKCDGTSNFSVNQLTGKKPFTFTWENGETDSVAKALCIGFNTVTVTDKNGCSFTDSVKINDNVDPLSVTIDTTITQCGKATGAAVAHVLGGVKDYAFKWSNGITDSTNNGLVVGYYGITVTDAMNCTLVDTVKVEDTSHISYTKKIISDVHCAGKAIGVASVSDTAGGHGPYSILWQNGDKRWLADTLRSGIIEIRVIDDSLCIGLDKIFMKVDSVLTINKVTVVNDVSCGGTPTGNIKIDITNGKPKYKYTWNPAADDTNQLYNLSPGVYNVTVTDQYSCETTSSISILKRPLLVDSIKLTDATCYGLTNGTITVAPKDGFGNTVSYKWSNGDTVPTADTLGIGKYYVTITETGNVCTAVDSFTITQPQQFSATYQTLKKTSCKDSTGIVTAHVKGGTKPYSFTWTEMVKPGVLSTDSTFINYWSNYFRMTVTDANGCKFIDSTRTTDTSLLAIKQGPTVPISCYGKSDGSLSVAPEKGIKPYTYSWNHDATVIDSIAKSLKKGMYIVRVTDDSACWRDFVFPQFNDPDSMMVKFTIPAKIKCFGESDSIKAYITGGNGGYTINWSKANKAIATTDTIITNATIGTYTINVSDTKGCTVKDSVAMKQADSTIVNYTVANTGCGSGGSTGSIKINSIVAENVPVTYKWDNGSSNATYSNLSKNIYTLSLTDNAGCKTTRKIEVKSDEFDSVRVDSVKKPFCNYNSATGTIAVTAWGSVSPYTYKWSNNATKDTLKKVNSGRYYVTVTANNECTITDSLELLPVVNIKSEIQIAGKPGAINSYKVCPNDTLHLRGVGIKIGIDNGANLPAPNEKFIWDVNGERTEEMLATLSSDNDSLVSVWPFTNTTYSFWYSLYGCYAPVQDIAVSYQDKIGINIDIIKENATYHDAVKILSGLEIKLKPNKEPWFVDSSETVPGFVEYTWSSFDSTMHHDNIINDLFIDRDYYIAHSSSAALAVSPEKTTWYRVIAKNNFGCYERDSVKITVMPDFSIPSGISPNGDGVNDVWDLPYLNQFPDVKVTIFNRWGIIVWEQDKNYSTNPFVGKNMDNKELPLGTYYYIIEFNDAKGTQPKSGSITIVR